MKSRYLALGLPALLLGTLLLVASIGIVNAQEQGRSSTICDRLSSISRLFPSCNVTPPPPPPGPPAPPPAPPPTPPAPPPTPPSEPTPSRLCERYLSSSSRGTPPPSCDICPNVNGIQLTGQCADKICTDGGGTWEGNSCVFPPLDICPNVPGMQTTGPCADSQCQESGGTWNGNSCEMPVPPPVDVCPNVPGDQVSGPCANETCVAEGGTWNGTACTFPPPPACADGIDNDDDDRIDFPTDGGCASTDDDSEEGSGDGGGGGSNVSIATEFVFADAEVTSSNDGDHNDVGFFTIFFSIEAVGGTAYISPSALEVLSGGGNTIDEHIYRIEKSDTATTSNIANIVVFPEDATVSPSGNLVLEEGESSIIGIAVARQNENNGDTGFYRMLLEGIAWNTVDERSDYNNFNTELADYETDYIFLN